MSNEEKYIDETFTDNLVEMATSNDKESLTLFDSIFDNILESDSDTEDLVNELENKIQKADNILTSNVNKDKKYKYSQNYIKLCLLHTRAKMCIDDPNFGKEEE